GKGGGGGGGDFGEADHGVEFPGNLARERPGEPPIAAVVGERANRQDAHVDVGRQLAVGARRENPHLVLGRLGAARKAQAIALEPPPGKESDDRKSQPPWMPNRYVTDTEA